MRKASMGLMGLFRRRRHERAGFALYTEAVRAARDPFYFAELDVPDTMDGRFDMVGVYAFLLLDRIGREPEGRALAQAVFDAMFLDMDGTLRELGVSDIKVGRNVKAMWEALHGRSQAYAGPVAADDAAALAEALARNVWRAAPPAGSPARLAEIVLAQYRHLAGQPFAGLLEGRVEWLATPQRAAA